MSGLEVDGYIKSHPDNPMWARLFTSFAVAALLFGGTVYSVGKLGSALIHELRPAATQQTIPPAALKQ